MEHIAALLLIIGCSQDMKVCEELPAPVPVYETATECDSDLQAALRQLDIDPSGIWFSLLALLAAGGVIALRILDRAEVWSGDLEGEQMSARAFEAVQVSLESALAGLLVFFLVYAAYRLMRRQVTVWSVLFTLAVLVALVGWIPLEETEALADARDWLVRVPVSAGARGILIGVGLGTVAAGVRVLTGQDRSIRG